MYHTPVLLQQSVDGLNIKPEGTYVDATYGGGGHSRAILKLLEDGRLYGFDQDLDAGQNSIEDPRFTFINQNFRYLKNFLKFEEVMAVDGILADLGISSHQINEGHRGFSTRLTGPLDMRMNANQPLSAREVVNNYEEEQLLQIFRDYGEIRNASCVVRAIEQHRPLETTEQLTEAVIRCAPPNKQHKFLAMVFQAIRIEVNEELQALREFLEQSRELLKPGGRLVVISYHSLEDRLVKYFIRTGNFEGKTVKDFYGRPIVTFRAITRKPVVPGEDEIASNSRARSAKLRIAEKL
ncbi:MAG: 16S rRNA (cytosine(1402)-N(4))-methyltransferase RsmH [bacterium]